MERVSSSRHDQVQFDFSSPEDADPASIEAEPLPGELPPTTDQFDAIVLPDEARAQQAPDPEATTTPHIEPEPEPEAAEAQRESFGAWLLNQAGRKGWIGDLAKAAKSDRSFPKRGSPDEVRKRLQELGADGDAFEAVDDAELDWASL